MDYMDIDQVLEVPDTPDRLPSQKINGRNFIQNKTSSSVAGHPGSTDVLGEGVRDRQRGRSKLVIENGHSERPSLRPSKSPSFLDKSESDNNLRISALGNSSSSKNAHLFRRTATDKATNHGTQHSTRPKHMEKGKALLSSQSSACQGDNAVVDLTKQNGRAQEFEKASPCRVFGNSQAQDNRKGSISNDGFSSLHVMANPSMTSGNVWKGKEKIVDTRKVGSGSVCGKNVDLFANSQPNARGSAATSVHITTSPRVTGQKRLVRNGYISPHNIAKAKPQPEKQKSGSSYVHSDIGKSDGSPSVVDIRDLIAEDNDSRLIKGKGVVTHPFSFKEPDTKAMHLPSRSSMNHGEMVNATIEARKDSIRCFEGLGGWRNTRNRTKHMNVPLSDGEPHSWRKDHLHSVDQQRGNRMVKRDNGNGSNGLIYSDYPKNQDSFSIQHGSSPTLAQAVHDVRSQFGQRNDHHQPANTLAKINEQGSSSSNRDECSKFAFDDSELVFLGSSEELSNAMSTRGQNHRGLGILDPVIEIDELSPEIRRSGSQNVGSSSNNDSDASARQVEADEMLARELQEQLYNESPVVGVGEIDSRMRLALQQEEDSLHAFSGGSPQIFHPRGGLRSNLYQQSRNPSIRRGRQARAPSSSRMARLRSRLPSHSPRVSIRERNSVFPPSMDVDMRMHILEALEAFSDMEMAGHFLQVQRDFNENDYEMLLALDENNHQHVGASVALIDGLPQSAVQSDNFEESCAICLETPTIGDTIRHLPCLHKFHKDCIDPWLRRKTSCPICKSSIT